MLSRRLIPHLLQVAGCLFLLVVTGGCSQVSTKDLVPITADNAAQVEELADLPEHAQWIHSLDISPDGSLLAIGDDDSTIRLWKTLSGKKVKDLRSQRYAAMVVAFSPDGSLIASGGPGEEVILWDTKPGRSRAHLDSPDTHSLAFSPDGRMLVTVAGNEYFPETLALQVWDIEAAMSVEAIPLDVQPASIAFSPDGTLLATSSVGGDLQLWNVDGQTIIERLTLDNDENLNIRGLAFSPDGRVLASGSNGGLARLWDVETGDLVLTMEGHESWIMDLEFTPDGSVLITCSRDETIRFWDTRTGAELAALTPNAVLAESAGRVDWVTSLALNEDGTLLAAAVSILGKSTVRLYGIPGD